jgi:hypothetical protein
MKDLPYHQKHIVDLIKSLAPRHELTAGGVGISFQRQAMAALIKKGLVREVARVYPNGGTYTAYELTGKE